MVFRCEYDRFGRISNLLQAAPGCQLPSEAIRLQGIGFEPPTLRLDESDIRPGFGPGCTERCQMRAGQGGRQRGVFR